MRMRGEYDLMVTVLAQQVKDYFSGIKASTMIALTKKEKKEKDKITGRAAVAKDYFKSKSVSYVFDFEFICLFIGLDPQKMRERILAIRTTEDLNNIFERFRKLKSKEGEP